MRRPRYVERHGDRILVHVPYHERFAHEAPELDGHLAWVFDASKEEEVRALVKSLYGDEDAQS